MSKELPPSTQEVLVVAVTSFGRSNSDERYLNKQEVQVQADALKKV